MRADPMTLGEYLTQQKIGDEEFAESIGVDRTAVSRYRRNKRLPRPDTILRIQRVTDGAVTPADFYQAA